LKSCQLTGEIYVSGNDTTVIQEYIYDSQDRPLQSTFENFSYPSANEVAIELLTDQTTHYFLDSRGFATNGFTYPAPGTNTDTSWIEITYNTANRIDKMDISKALVYANKLVDIEAVYTYDKNNLESWTVNIPEIGVELFSFDYTYGTQELRPSFNCGYFENRLGAFNYFPGLQVFGEPIKNLPASRDDGNSMKTYEYSLDENGLVEHFVVFLDGTKQFEKWYSYEITNGHDVIWKQSATLFVLDVNGMIRFGVCTNWKTELEKLRKEMGQLFQVVKTWDFPEYWRAELVEQVAKYRMQRWWHEGQATYIRLPMPLAMACLTDTKKILSKNFIKYSTIHRKPKHRKDHYRQIAEMNFLDEA